MRGEYGESEGQQVLRHLKGIVAWHAAAVGLLDGRFRHVTQRLVVGLVEVTSNESKLFTDEEVIQESFRRYPNPSPEDRRFIENSIRENHEAAEFTGTTHAEATLMGLLKSFPPAPPFTNHIEIEGVQFLKQLIEPVCLLSLPLCIFDVQAVRMQATFENAIAVNKKCCWCCDRLGTLLGDVKLPGSHGVLYSWRPPRVGVDVSVLRSFESHLWDEMKAAIGDTIPHVHSRPNMVGRRGTDICLDDLP